MVWPDRLVSESALSSRIEAARRAVGDDGQQQRVIAAAHGVGYRLAVEVQVVQVDDWPMPDGPATIPLQQVRYCTSPDRVRIEYAISGRGTRLVKAANCASGGLVKV